MDCVASCFLRKVTQNVKKFLPKLVSGFNSPFDEVYQGEWYKSS